MQFGRGAHKVFECIRVEELRVLEQLLDAAGPSSEVESRACISTQMSRLKNGTTAVAVGVGCDAAACESQMVGARCDRHTATKFLS